jgi:hypothetical protein
MANEEMIQKHLDNFLAKIAGETPVDDTIQNSTEFWINKIAEQGGGGTEVVANPTLAGTEDPLTGLEVDGTKYKVRDGSTNGLGYLTTAPTAANTDGIKIVVLSSEPTTKYDGYLYLITEA